MEAIDYEQHYYEQRNETPNDYESDRYKELNEAFDRAQESINNMQEWKKKISTFPTAIAQAEFTIDAAIRLQTWLEKQMIIEKDNY